MKRQIRQISGQATLFKVLKHNTSTSDKSNETPNEDIASTAVTEIQNAVDLCSADSKTPKPSASTRSVSETYSMSISPNVPEKTPHSLGPYLDIGNQDIKNRLRMADNQKYSVLKTRFEPIRGWVAPLRECGKKSRRVPDFVFDSEQYPYLRYSPMLDGVFCAPCHAFNATDNVLVARPLTDWSNAKRVVDSHKNSKEHLNALAMSDNFVKICNKEEQSIVEFGSDAYRKKVFNNRQALVSIIEGIIVCGRQNLALRGKTDEKSNIRALINYRARADSTLKKHIDTAPKHATYISPSIQNEFISLCGQQISKAIIQRCKNAKYFTILADESADVSDIEQFAFCIRYVDRETSGIHVVREEFVSFVSTESTTGEALHALLSAELRKHDLNPTLVVGQGYDGAGNMQGRIRGVQARFSEEYPNAKYVHCRNHRLNLAICHACRVAFVQSMFTIVGDILFFMTCSPKRLAIYKHHNDNGEKLRKLCPTRWSQHSESVSAFHKNFSAISETMTDLQVIRGMDTKTVSSAAAFQKAMLSFDFIIALCAVSGPLDILNPLSDSMQDPNCDLVKASDHALTLHGLLQEKRNDQAAYDSIWQKSVDLANREGVPVTRPRVAARQCHRNNIPADTVKEYWRLNLYLPFMDHLLFEIQDRLCIALPRMKAQYLLSHKIGQLTPLIVDEIKHEYAPYIEAEAMDVELEVWKHKIAQGGVFERLAESVDETYQTLPNLHTILKILLTMPVSTASAERSFSSLRRLKTYLRSTMTEQRLTGLALMHIHRSHEINTEQVLQDFDASGHRRIVLAFGRAENESSDDE